VKTFFPLSQTTTEFKTKLKCSPSGCFRKPEPESESERKPLQKVTPEKITVTALNGHSISRCQHGSFWTERFGPIYCESCCPGASLRMIGENSSPMNGVWVSPRKNEKPAGHIFANPTAPHGSAGQCPECACQFHVELSDGRWQCPDCEHVWKGKAVKGEPHAAATNS
jgi:ribosomal protein L37AE/L43A